MNKKFHALLDILRNMRSALLAFSGGVDSTFLLYALRVSGIRSLPITVQSELVPLRDIRRSREMAHALGYEHRIVTIDILLRDGFSNNPPDRCFLCKDSMFSLLTPIALEEGYDVVLDGSTLDDTTEFRPGRKASEKHGVRSPLIEAAFSKAEVRTLSRRAGLQTWDIPSSSCLATRFPYDYPLTKSALIRVEQAETFLESLGFSLVRVRTHGSVARIELLPKEMTRLLDTETRAAITDVFTSLGYSYVTVDLGGYRSGSMDKGSSKEF